MSTEQVRAHQLWAEARSHKRMSKWHREQAQKKMAEFRAFCTEAGIDIRVIAVSAETGEERG